MHKRRENAPLPHLPPLSLYIILCTSDIITELTSSDMSSLVSLVSCDLALLDVLLEIYNTFIITVLCGSSLCSTYTPYQCSEVILQLIPGFRLIKGEGAKKASFPPLNSHSPDHSNSPLSPPPPQKKKRSFDYTNLHWMFWVIALAFSVRMLEGRKTASVDEECCCTGNLYRGV